MANDKTQDFPQTLTPGQVEQLKNLDVEEDIELGNQRKVKGNLAKGIMIWAAITSVLHLYFLVFRPIDPLLLRAMHLMTLTVLGYLLVPGAWGKKKETPHFMDWLAALASISIFLYIFITFEQLIWRIRVRPTDADVLMAVIGVILVLELTRRCTGNALLLLSGVFIAYALFGHNLPGILAHSGFGFRRFMGYIYSDYGIFSAPIAISSRFIILFIIFAAFLTASGVGKYFVEWAFSISGSARGGPAKVAVLASALMGTMSGTSAGNAVATGSLTIPLMKKVGYSSVFAAATEAVASTGGQVMPPIMGAGIFIMAEITGIPFRRIMLAGLIPAILYFTSVYLMVDYEAIKLKLVGFPRQALPNFLSIMKRGYLFVPVFLLFYLLLTGWTVIFSGFAALISSFAVSWLNAAINRKIELGMGLMKVIKALENGARGSIQIMAVCAAAGIIMGVIALTGVGIKFADLLLGIAGANELLALIFAMGVAILLGMGMPTTAAYAIAASILAPGLVRMGLPVLVAHLFVFYYACLSAITPPVALAAYAASGISGSDPMKTSYMSFRLGLTAYVVPFMFYFSPALIFGNQKDAMLLQTLLADGTETVTALAVVTILLRTAIALVGVWSLASAVQGWYFGKAPIWVQGALFVITLTLVVAHIGVNLAGLAMLAVLAFVQLKKKKQEASLLSSTV